MDTRIALNRGKVLRFDNGAVEYTIQNEFARGGSSIVYNASYIDNVGDQKIVRIKECYPFKLDISRDNMGNLIPAEYDISEFEQAKDRMRDAYKLGNIFFKKSGLTNYTVNTYNLFEANKTVYIVSAYLQGEELSHYAVDSLKIGISIVRNVALTIHKIHNEGYLYLDIKPDNIFILNGTVEIIQLFDFDALIPVNAAKRNEDDCNYKISYTKGFAALEQQMGNLKKIGIHSDVYGIGALLFYLVFDRAPNALDCSFDANYEFSLSKWAVESYQDKLFFRLTEFFHNTLANYYRDRFQDMEVVLDKLEELQNLADTAIPYIHSTKVNKPQLLIGRTNEISCLSKWFSKNESNCLFVTGMGGIGKSTLVRFFIAENYSDFDTVIYINFDTSILKTVIDDVQISINTIKKDEKETINEYFIRKLNAIRELALGKNIVIVIDNYNDEAFQDFGVILSIAWKVVFIARNKSLAQGYDLLEIKEISQTKDIYLMFENYLGRALCESDSVYLDNIIKKVSGHTLVIELIAKQIANSHISISEASALIDKQGFFHIASEKVVYMKDYNTYHETIEGIISSLFEATHLSEIKRMLIKIISLFGINGVDIEIFSDMLELNTKDDINELISESWIKIDDKRLTEHSVILEICHQWELTKGSERAVIQVMKYLFKKLKSESKKEEYPKNLIEDGKMLKSFYETPQNKKSAQKLRNQLSNKGVIGEIVMERIFQSEIEMTTDYSKVKLYLQLAECFLEECKKERKLYELDAYKDLMYQVIINMPREKDKFILCKAEELMGNICQNKSTTAVLDLYSKIISIYEEKGDFRNAYEKLNEAEIIAKNCRENFIRGQYYYLCARYYDAMLAGQYNAVTEEDNRHLKYLLDNLDKAIRYMKKSKAGNTGQCLGEYYLFKAEVQIKGKLESPTQIKKILDKAKRLIEKHAQAQSKLFRDYFMTCAWFHTYIEPDYESARVYISKAHGIINFQTELDEIDELLLPCAKIYMQWGKYTEAALNILVAIVKCEKYGGILVYLRKEKELLLKCFDVYYKAYDFEKCKIIIRFMDRFHETSDTLESDYMISPELRKEIFSK